LGKNILVIEMLQRALDDRIEEAKDGGDALEALFN